MKTKIFGWITIGSCLLCAILFVFLIAGFAVEWDSIWHHDAARVITYFFGFFLCGWVASILAESSEDGNPDDSGLSKIEGSILIGLSVVWIIFIIFINQT